MRTLLSLCIIACAVPQPPQVLPLKPLNEETHFADIKQLTFGGENAEAYWGFSGQELIMQAHGDDKQCDQIYRIDRAGKTTPVSNGDGATTCSFFLPGDKEVIYASTHLGGKACPPKADHSQGYVWSLYPSYDIFRSNADGSQVQRLTDAPGYDAEGTVCGKDGSIIFTSVRDGDLELYRMDKDGKNVKRLTHTPGYDGGAFFNADCSKIVWRASRPKPGPELEDFQRLLKQNLVRPSKLELYVANADGSDARQITYLDSASFAPYFHPSGKRILFSSNYGDPKGREFDIFAINTDGTGLERVTHSPGFDGFPMFSPDGRTLAFSSNRATAPGKGDTNVFLATWNEGETKPLTRAEDRIAKDVFWLASPERGGRGTGDDGLKASASYLHSRLSELASDRFSVTLQPFKVTLKVEEKVPAVLRVNGQALTGVKALPASASGKVKGKLVFAEYGLKDDYKNAKDAIVLVRRFVPEGTEGVQGDLRRKAWLAREAGAKALLVADLPNVEQDKMPPEAAAPGTDTFSDSGIPMLLIKRADAAQLLKKKNVTVELEVQLTAIETEVSNIVAHWQGKGDPLVIGAHYDHLGMGGRNSLAPDQHAPHVGADDNASGTAALLEIAARVTEQKPDRDIYFVGFSAEELGVLGSTEFVKQFKGKIAAMLNMDMIGRLQDNKVQVLGSETATEWSPLLKSTCETLKINCAGSGGGYGPSDQTPFYAASVPVLHFFTGAHGDYHKPSDTADKINYAGVARIASVVTQLALTLPPLTFVAGASTQPVGYDRRSFNASLGTVPDYAGKVKGVLLAGVRPASAAEKAGLKRGDVLKRLGTHEITSVEDLMFALNASQPGQTVTAVFTREDAEQRTQVTFEERTHR